MIHTASYTDIGGRGKNEDCVRMTRRENGLCLVVADGLGGHGGGADASCAAAYHYLMSANRKVPLIGFGNDEWKKTLGITAVDFESEEFALALLAALQEEEPTDKKVAPLLHRRSFGF